MIKYPISVLLELTSECNLRCLHCYNNSGVTVNELNYEKLCEQILDFDRNGVIAMTVSGGEPLLYDKIWDLFEFVNTNTNLKITINSNGLLLDDTTIGKLKKYNISDIQISIDGSEEHHNSIRGNNTYNKTIINIKNCISNDIKVRIGYTINAKNYLDIESFVSSMENIGVSSIAFYRFVPTSNRNIDNMLDLDEVMLRDISKKLISLSVKYNKLDNFKIFFESLSFFAFLHDKRYLKLTKCLAGDGQLNLCFDENIYLCSHFRESIGGINDGTIKYLWQKQNKTTKLLKEIVPDDCIQCEYSSKCKGGCKGIVKAYYNDLTKKDPCCFKGII